MAWANQGWIRLKAETSDRDSLAEPERAGTKIWLYRKVQLHTVTPYEPLGSYAVSQPPFHFYSRHLRCGTYVRCRTCMAYDILRATHDIVLYIVRAMSYVLYTGYRRTTSYVRHRLYVQCRMCTYDIVSDRYDILGCHFNISYTMSYVLKGPSISYVHDIRYRRLISYTTSYVSGMTYDVVCEHTTSYVRHTMSYVF